MGIDHISLSYPDVGIGSTVNPVLTVEPADANIVSKKYEITTGGSYASIDATTGVLTGKANGVAVVKVSVTDAFGTTETASTVVTIGTPASDMRYIWNKYDVNNSPNHVQTEQSIIGLNDISFNRNLYLGQTQSYTLGSIGWEVSGTTITSYRTVTASVTFGTSWQNASDDVWTDNITSYMWLHPQYYQSGSTLYWGMRMLVTTQAM